MTSNANSIEGLGFGNFQVHTQIDIEAPAQVVWGTLTDFADYDWSSSFKGLDHPVEPAATVTATFVVSGKERSIDHELIDVEPGVQWAWSDVFMLGMADYHVYRVEPIDEMRSRFIQRDRPHGGAGLVLARVMARSFFKMYETFNAELKAEAERRHGAN